MTPRITPSTLTSNCQVQSAIEMASKAPRQITPALLNTISTRPMVASAVVAIVTLGSGYRAAVATFKEGCGGDWILTPEHVAGKIPPRSELE